MVCRLGSRFVSVECQRCCKEDDLEWERAKRMDGT